MKTSIIVSFFVTCTISNLVMASQPLNNSDSKTTIAAYESLAMSESDLDDVSAVAGLNVLDIYGQPAAGLTVDDEDSSQNGSSVNKTNDSQQYSEGESTLIFASNELKQIEEEHLSASQTSSTEITPNTISIQDESLVTGEATGFTTTSEINYKSRNVHHEMTKLQGDSISISRDLHIDLLKIENLRGDHFDESRSAGSIYLSDWTSRGDTVLTPR